MPMIQKIGIQLYTVREHFKTPEQAAQTFRALKALGYDEAQTAGCYGMPYDQFYALAAEAGIEIVGTHDDFGQMKDDIETAIANHKMLHTVNMGIGGFGAESAEAALRSFQSGRLKKSTAVNSTCSAPMGSSCGRYASGTRNTPPMLNRKERRAKGSQQEGVSSTASMPSAAAERKIAPMFVVSVIFSSTAMRRAPRHTEA